MSDEILLTIGEDGKASLYDDTYDITIHCESKEEQDEVRKALENTPHWIPVTERLPVLDGRYLVCGKKGGIYHANYRQGWWMQVGCGGKLVPSVVAWCELPEPYKGVTE